MRNYNLPNDDDQLHKIINKRPNKFRRLLKGK